jgi:hypothetical protein
VAVEVSVTDWPKLIVAADDTPLIVVTTLGEVFARTGSEKMEFKSKSPITGNLIGRINFIDIGKTEYLSSSTVFGRKLLKSSLRF